MSSRPEPEETPVGPVATQRVGALTWRPIAVLVTIAAIIAVATIRPWDLGKQSPGLTARVVVVHSPDPQSSPSPTIDPAIDAASSRMQCNAPPAWRLVSMETDVLGDSRTMYGTEPSVATGPDDPSIPTVQLHASKLVAVGVCRPNPGGERIPDLPMNPVTIWQLSGMAQTAVEIEDPSVLDNALYRLGEVYLGPPLDQSAQSDAGQRTTWPPGRYVVEISAANSHDQALWIALDFTNIESAAGALRP